MERAAVEERLGQWRFPGAEHEVRGYEADDGTFHTDPACSGASGAVEVVRKYRDVRERVCRRCPPVDGGRAELYLWAGSRLPERTLPDEAERFEEVFAHLEQLEEVRAELVDPHLAEELAEVNRGIEAGWRWLGRDEVRSALTAAAAREVSRRDGSPPGMWEERHLVVVQQRYPGWGRWLLVPFWLAQRGTLWLAHAPLGVVQLVEDEQPGNVEVAEVPRAAGPEVLEAAAALWRDGGTYQDPARAVEAALALSGR